MNELHEAVADIIRDGKRASEVIAGVRALFKKQQAQKVRLAVNEVIEEALVWTRDAVERHDVLLHTSLADDLPPVLGDRVQLQQVVLNLVRKRHRGHGFVTGRPRELQVASDARRSEKCSRYGERLRRRLRP